jgi:DNA polymerase III alpha subunit
MFLAVIRPAKRHLIGLSWAEVAKTIWDKPMDGGYGYKKSHGVAYAHLVCVHMNLLTEQERQSM